MRKMRLLLGFYFLLTINVWADYLAHHNCWLQLELNMFQEDKQKLRKELINKGYVLLQKDDSVPALVFRDYGEPKKFLQIFQNFTPLYRDDFAFTALRWEGSFKDLPRCMEDTSATWATLMQEVEVLSEVGDGMDSP